MRNINIPEGWSFRKTGELGYVITKENEHTRSSTAVFPDEESLTDQFLLTLLSELAKEPT
jgi:hypothetical protein